MDYALGILLWLVCTAMTSAIIGRYTDWKGEQYVFNTILWPLGLCFVAGHVSRNLKL